MALLQDRQGNGHIVGSFVVLPVLIEQVLVVDVAQELSVESSQVGGHKGVLPEAVLFHHILRQFSRISRRGLSEDEVGVDEPDVFSAENAVEDLQHLPADQLIVPIDHHENIIGFAQLDCCLFDVEEGSHVVEVALHLVSVLSDLSLLLHEGLDNLHGSIGRSIVDNHNMVVGVVLHHYRPDIPQSPLFLLVVVGRDDHAERQLSQGPDLVFFFIV